MLIYLVRTTLHQYYLPFQADSLSFYRSEWCCLSLPYQSVTALTQRHHELTKLRRWRNVWYSRTWWRQSLSVARLARELLDTKIYFWICLNEPFDSYSIFRSSCCAASRFHLLIHCPSTHWTCGLTTSAWRSHLVRHNCHHLISLPTNQSAALPAPWKDAHRGDILDDEVERPGKPSDVTSPLFSLSVGSTIKDVRPMLCLRRNSMNAWPWATTSTTIFEGATGSRDCDIIFVWDCS